MSYICARRKQSSEASVWNAYHINLTVSLVMMSLLAVNAASFVVWIKQLSTYDFCHFLFVAFYVQVSCLFLSTLYVAFCRIHLC